MFQMRYLLAIFCVAVIIEGVLTESAPKDDAKDIKSLYSEKKVTKCVGNLIRITVAPEPATKKKVKKCMEYLKNIHEALRKSHPDSIFLSFLNGLFSEPSQKYYRSLIV